MEQSNIRVFGYNEFDAFLILLSLIVFNVGLHLLLLFITDSTRNFSLDLEGTTVIHV